MRASIVEVAYSLVEEGGAEAVSIREIASRIEYSLRTIYLYFRDKEAILDAVRERGFAELAAYLAAAVEADYTAVPGRAASERLRRLGHAYLAFAQERARLFGIMYFREPPIVRRAFSACDDPEKESAPAPCEAAETSRAFSILSGAVAEYLGSSAADEARVRSVAFALWGLVHGLATLALFEQDKEFRGVDIAVELDRALATLMP
jgi:AcrR family transcriptional regulator